MKEKTCCFTGHRSIPALKLIVLKKKLKNELITLIEGGYTDFITGGAIGFDTLAAEAVLALKKDYPHIKLRLVLPCREQDKYWTAQQKKDYRRILDLADSHEYVSESYTRYCMFQRNKKMVDESSVVISFFDGNDKGGTAMTVSYANKKGIPVINLY